MNQQANIGSFNPEYVRAMQTAGISGGGPKEVLRRGQCSNQLEELHASIDNLDKALAVLEERLSAFKFQTPPPANTLGGLKDSQLVPFAEKIRVERELVDSLTQRVRQLTEGLEL